MRSSGAESTNCRSISANSRTVVRVSSDAPLCSVPAPSAEDVLFDTVESAGHRRMTMSSKATAAIYRVSADDVEISRLCKALGHPVRVRILRYLAAHEGCVCGDLVDVVGLAQSTVSEHLRIAKDPAESETQRCSHRQRRPILRGTLRGRNTDAGASPGQATRWFGACWCRSPGTTRELESRPPTPRAAGDE
jgi:DNA-binding transcriptional ArsR family regulator